jgi:peptidoglycan-associated lipoprotein|tara:strand:+ start:8661 stop:9083 length:423 start_codon:yes stop_codon:yes gene_type:complete
MNVTEERVYDGGIKTVEASVVEVQDLDYETKAIFANATVFFEFDSYNLTSKSIQTLKSVVSVMNSNIDIEITLAGHADERGTREYNLALGQRRAESVKDYFLLNGIMSSRVTVKSYGEERPLSLGNDEASYSKNRRVEIN